MSWPNDPRLKHVDPKEIERAFVEEGLTTLEACKRFGISKGTLYNRLRKHGRCCSGGHMPIGRGSRLCSLCQEPLGASHDLTEVAVGAALDAEANVEMVRGSAAQQLRSVGGIGALLRY